MRAKSLCALGAMLFVSACAHANMENLHPIPVSADADAGGDERGTPAASHVLGADDQVRISATLVRDFFRPFGHQARLIDPRPLAHLRSADDTVSDDSDWSTDIARASGLRKVCPADEADACAGLPGGVLRLSRAYASGPDTATVYVRYTPITAAHEPMKDTAGEMRFTLARRDAEWKIVSRLNAVGTNR